MLKFYFNGSPNPTNVALFLEESSLAYDPIPSGMRRGAQCSHIGYEVQYVWGFGPPQPPLKKSP